MASCRESPLRWCPSFALMPDPGDVPDRREPFAGLRDGGPAVPMRPEIEPRGVASRAHGEPCLPQADPDQGVWDVLPFLRIPRVQPRAASLGEALRLRRTDRRRHDADDQLPDPCLPRIGHFPE